MSRPNTTLNAVPVPRRCRVIISVALNGSSDNGGEIGGIMGSEGEI